MTPDKFSPEDRAAVLKAMAAVKAWWNAEASISEQRANEAIDAVIELAKQAEKE